MKNPVIEAAQATFCDEPVWVVGGAVRDRLLARATSDVDFVLTGDVRAAARRLARALKGFAFPLSEEFGGWRVISSDRKWQADFNPLRGITLAADLLARDFTVNALAEPLAGGPIIDPTGGLQDLEHNCLRMVSSKTFVDDPLRVLRSVRISCELGFELEQATIGAARASAEQVANVAQERVFAELRRIIRTDSVVEGLELLDKLGVTAAVLPELAATKGVCQSKYHHLDVYEHTLEVVKQLVWVESNLAAVFGVECAERLAPIFQQPFADDLTRGDALRFGALFHDIGKPGTRAVTDQGQVTFMHHDRYGVKLARAVLRRLKTSTALRNFIAALVEHHLRLGFLVHQQPLDRSVTYRYLDTCSPVEVEVTVLSAADRLATRGVGSEIAITKHLELARSLMPNLLAWRANGRTQAPIGGRELAEALGITPGPELGLLLAKLAEACYVGTVKTPAEAITAARHLLSAD